MGIRYLSLFIKFILTYAMVLNYKLNQIGSNINIKFIVEIASQRLFSGRAVTKNVDGGVHA